MLTKKCKKCLKFVASLAVFLIYVTLDRYNSATIREERSKRHINFLTDSTTTTDKINSATIKTIVSYSREFKVRKVLEDQVVCVSDANAEIRSTSDAKIWKFDRKLGIQLFSAYYDRREEPYQYVRIIGLLPRNLSLYCQLWSEGKERMIGGTQKAVIDEIWSTSWGGDNRKCEETFPAIVSCLVPLEAPSTPVWVSFVDRNCQGDGTFLKIPVPELPTAKDNFVICVKPLHFTNLNPKTFLEWMEINRRLGVAKIVVYTSESTEMASIPDSDILLRKKFETPKAGCFLHNYEETTWHRRKLEIIAYNDCFYSHLDRTRFIVPLDVDEIIVPKTGNSWIEAFRRNFPNATGKDSFAPDKYASFSVRNAYFFSDYPKSAVVFSNFTLPTVTDRKVLVKVVSSAHQRRAKNGTSSPFDRTIRSYHLSPKSDSVKSFVHVSKTLSVFNHYAFHVLDDAIGRQYIFPENVFLLNHYRNSCDPVLIDGCQDFLNHVVYDDSLEKFRTSPGQKPSITDRYRDAVSPNDTVYNIIF